MRQLLMLMLLVVMGAVGVRTQQPSPYTTHGQFNGVGWRASSYVEKLTYVEGAGNGYILGVITVLSIGTCSAAGRSLFHRNSPGDIVKEMDRFYGDGANISLPMINAYQYSQMKLSGATKQELDDYLSRSRQAIH